MSTVRDGIPLTSTSGGAAAVKESIEERAERTGVDVGNREKRKIDVKKPLAYSFGAQRFSLSAKVIRVEADITPGVHTFSVIGLPDKAIGEARERVSAAIKHAGFTPIKQRNRKIILSLAPSEMKKTGALFDVPIALTCLLAEGDISFDPKEKMFIGEMALDGKIQKARGILPLIQCAKENKFKEVYIPADNADEAALIEGVTVIPCASLNDILSHLLGTETIAPVLPKHTAAKNERTDSRMPGFESVKGQEVVKRALTIAGAGGHNVALYGPPGTGKTLLAKALTTILPPLSQDECVEVTALHSIGRADVTEPVRTPPFRHPHHTSSHTAVVGGGPNVSPGEISLAHRGVLFLDEFPEFDRRTIESLREPLEEQAITITRTSGSYKFPASCILIVAFNLCPCGKTGTDKPCTCSTTAKAAYHRKLSGPIADRIDVWVSVEPVEFEKLVTARKEKETAVTDTARNQVAKARQKQKERYAASPIALNSEVDAGGIDTHIPLSPESKQALQKSAEGLSPLPPRLPPHHKMRPHHRRPRERRINPPRTHL